MDCELSKKYRDNLNKYNLPKWELIPQKTQLRIISIHKFIESNNCEVKKLKDELKNKRLTKTSIAKNEDLKISRKTLYNDEILMSYINGLLSEQEDIFNEELIKYHEKKYADLKKQYCKVLENAIDTQELIRTVANYEKDYDELITMNNKLHELLSEKNEVISDLKKNIVHDNVIELNK